MTALIALLSTLVYVTGVAASGRYWYGLWRAYYLNHGGYSGWETYSYVTGKYVRTPVSERITKWNKYRRWGNGLGAVGTGLFWPVVMPMWLLAVAVMWSPRKSQAELKAEADAMKKKIKQLEEEAGIE